MSALGIGAARALARRRLLALDPARSIAIKRNVHEAEVDVGATRFAAALGEVLRDPGEVFGLVRVRRPEERIGAPFVVGERFAGSFSVARLVAARFGDRVAAPLERPPLATWLQRLEEAWLSDYAELLSLREPAPGEDGVFEVRYGYLSGTPIAGSSTYRIEPTPAGARLRHVFEYQELGAMALAVVQRFAARWHDEVIALQVRKAAARAGGRVLSCSIREEYPRDPVA